MRLSASSHETHHLLPQAGVWRLSTEGSACSVQLEHGSAV